jgi:GPH family glycoside/pentoside/hexuronide:cation symporter
VLFIAGIVTLMNVAVRNGTLLYYFKYYVGDDGSRIFLIFDKTAVFMSLGTLAFLVGVSMTKALSQRFEKRTLMIVLSLLNAISMAAFYITPADQYWLMVFINCVGTLVVGPTPALVWSMYADTADYGEYKNGRRTTALVFSTVQFSHKLGLAVGAGLSGIILASFGFVANEVQTETAMQGIRFMFSIFPAVLAVIGVIAIYFYRIDSSLIATMERELAKRRADA